MINDMDEISLDLIKTDEDKKWAISRIDLYHTNTVDSLKNMQERFESAAKLATSYIRDLRNYVFAAFGIFVTLFLGYNSLFPLEQWVFFVVLVPVVIVAFTLFLIFGWLNKLIREFFEELTMIIREEEERILGSQGFMTTFVTFLPTVKPESLVNYFAFIMLLNEASLSSMGKSYKKLAKKYSLFKDIRNELLGANKILSNRSEFIPMYFSKLDRTQPVPPNLMEFIDTTLKKFKIER